MANFLEAIRDRVSSLVFRGRAGQTTTADETQDDLTRTVGALASDNALRLSRLFHEEKGRTEIIKLCREMYDTDTRAKTIIQTLARDATKGGFQFECDDPEATQIVEDLRQRLKLNKRIDDWVRLTLRDGDSFLEVGVDSQMDIEVVSRKPTLNMRRNSNPMDQFDDPLKAFWYSPDTYVGVPGSNAIWFAEWQIMHARWDHEENERYGRPLFTSAKGSWKRVKEGELDVSVRRKTRAGIKYHHVIEGASEPEIEAYKLRNQSALGSALAAVSDFFSNKEGTIKVIEGDSRLGELDDVRHHLKTFWLASPVPMAILGYGEDIDFSVVGHQKEQYDETLGQVQEWVEDQFLVPLFELQWLLRGILPERVDYKITWPTKKTVTAQDIQAIIQAASGMRALNFPEEVIAMVVAQYLPGVEASMLKGIGSGGLPSGDDPQRMASAIDGLLQQLAQAKSPPPRNGKSKPNGRNDVPDEGEDDAAAEGFLRSGIVRRNGHR